MIRTIFILLVALFANCYSSDCWQRVYLATYPRSGNHWTRYLLEEATGIATSSVYPDPDGHMKTMFPWLGYCAKHGYEGNRRYPTKNDFIIIKTHYPTMITIGDNQNSVKNVRIIRNPIDSIWSWHTYSGGKADNLNADKLKYYVTQFKAFHAFWDAQEGLTIRYEDLCEEPFYHLKEILDYIGYELKEEDIERAILKYPPKYEFNKHKINYKKNQLNYIYKQLDEYLIRYNYI